MITWIRKTGRGEVEKVMGAYYDWCRLGAGSAGLAIMSGAFGAHGLKARKLDPALLKAWETAAHYHLIHSVALVAASATNRLTDSTGAMFAGGMLLFSGSLYMMVLTGQKMPWGPITPIGGLTLVGAWLSLASSSPAAGKGGE